MNTEHHPHGARRTTVMAAGPETAPAGNVSVIAAELTAARCRWCNDDLEHCHDTLVLHAVGDMHCMSVDCGVPTEAHHMVVGCDDFGCTCGQAAGVAETA